MRNVKVYIAGPYSKGDVAVNVRNAVLAADKVLASGCVPFLPHLTHFWHMICPRPYEEWLALDNQWVDACDCLLRIPGESSGADKEAERMKRLGRPVFHTLEELLEVMSVSRSNSAETQVLENPYAT